MTIRRLRTILQWMLFSTHLMPMFLFQLFLCLFQLGYTLFSKAMSMNPHYLKSSNSWLVTLLWYCIPLGMDFLWDTQVVWCFPITQTLNMWSFMNFMLLHWQGTLGSSKHMSWWNLPYFGRGCNNKFNIWFLNMLLVSTTRVKLHSLLNCLNLFPPLQGFGHIFRCISFKGSLKMEGIP